jgi:hypothetical protein
MALIVLPMGYTGLMLLIKKYLNVIPAMILGLEQGQRHARGAILKLLNILERQGISALAS